jgi:pimeloyl-ACP methyl ester carboxylesterase
MKKCNKCLILISILCICFGLHAQYPKGKVVIEHITSPALQNAGGENPTRRVTIYLPPDYDNTTNRYPVIYYLHGFTWSDSLQIARDHFNELLDKAIATGKIRPVIVVMPNQHTLYKGSWYTNSTLTGNWADFTAKDLVKFIDGKYRTIAANESRGITGHSMGGYGAIKIGMQFPDVFLSVYALSPGFLGYMKDFGPNSSTFKRANEIRTQEELNNPKSWNDLFANCVVAMGRTFSPNLNKPPFYADIPFTYEGAKLNVNYEILELWNKNSPIEMADDYVDNLRKLKALKLDWGRNEEVLAIPLTCQIFRRIYRYP